MVEWSRLSVPNGLTAGCGFPLQNALGMEMNAMCASAGVPVEGAKGSGPSSRSLVVDMEVGDAQQHGRC